MSRLTVPRWMSELRSQWVGNRRLRWGLLVVGGILWVQALLLFGDSAQVWRDQTSSLREEVDLVRLLTRVKVWPGRADDARQQLDALRSMLWQASDPGVAEAALQDWVRASAGRAGLSVRETAVSRPPAATGAASAVAAGTLPVRIRLAVDLNRLPLMAFLAELARNEQVIVVDRLLLRPAAQPPLAEMELRALVALRAEVR